MHSFLKRSLLLTLGMMMLNYESGRTAEINALHKYVKVNVDYSKDIIGLWECVEITGESTFDSPDHRWEYKDDGSYTYYSKDADGNWIADATNSGNEYYVDGDFLATRWTMNGKETRESWDIEKCDDSEMIWSALRIGKNGKEFTTKVVLRRVSDL